MSSSKVLLPAVLISICSMVPALAAELPTVEILYPPGGSLLDRLCKSDLKAPVDEKVLQAAVQQRSKFQEL